MLKKKLSEPFFDLVKLGLIDYESKVLLRQYLEDYEETVWQIKNQRAPVKNLNADLTDWADWRG